MWIKAGTDSPENFLGYAGFDNTTDLGGIATLGLVNGLHQYAPHVADWRAGDPDWNGGDGGFTMNSQEMETAVRLGLNVTVLILNDSSYGMIRWKQANMGFKDWGLEFNNPDFVKYAEAYGANGHRADSSDDLPRLLSHCLDTPGVHLIDCPVDYGDNDRILNNEIKELSAKL